MSVFVISYPYALWLARPTAIMVYTDIGNKYWLLIKGGNVTIRVFESGTLTHSKPKVIEFKTINHDMMNQYCNGVNEMNIGVINQHHE